MRENVKNELYMCGELDGGLGGKHFICLLLFTILCFLLPSILFTYALVGHKMVFNGFVFGHF